MLLKIVRSMQAGTLLAQLQDADITVHKPHPLIGCACAQQGVLLRHALVDLCKKNALQLEPEQPINVCLTLINRSSYTSCVSDIFTAFKRIPRSDWEGCFIR